MILFYRQCILFFEIKHILLYKFKPKINFLLRSATEHYMQLGTYYFLVI